MFFNVLIVEDNDLFLNSNTKSIRALAAKYDVEVEIKTFSCVGELLNLYIKENEIDLVLLDIEIGTHNGIRLAKKILKYHPFVSLIFITSYGKYIEKANALDPVGFLDKPVDFKRLDKLFCKAIISKQGKISLEEKNAKFITIRENRNLLEIKESEILYIRTYQRKLLIRVVERNIFITDTLTNVENMLSRIFVKAGRDIIINKTHVRRMDGDRVVMSNGEILDIPKRNIKEVIRKFHT